MQDWKKKSRTEEKLTAGNKPTAFIKGSPIFKISLAKHTEKVKIEQEKEEKVQTEKETNEAIYMQPIHWIAQN